MSDWQEMAPERTPLAWWKGHFLGGEFVTFCDMLSPSNENKVFFLFYGRKISPKTLASLHNKVSKLLWFPAITFSVARFMHSMLIELTCTPSIIVVIKIVHRLGRKLWVYIIFNTLSREVLFGGYIGHALFWMSSLNLMMISVHILIDEWNDYVQLSPCHMKFAQFSYTSLVRDV